MTRPKNRFVENLFLKGVVAVVSLATSICFARIFTAEEYGWLITYRSGLQVLVAVILFGTNLNLVRAIASNGIDKRIVVEVFQSVRFRWTWVLVIIGLAVTCSLLPKESLLIGLVAFAMVVNSVYQAIYVGNSEVKKSIVRQELIPLILSSAAFIALVLTCNASTLWFFPVTGLFYAINEYFNWREVEVENGNHELKLFDSRTQVTTGVGEMVEVLTLQIGIIFVAQYFELKDVPEYAIPFRLVTMTNLVLVTMATTFSPRIAKHYSQGKSLKEPTRVVFVVGLFLALAFLVVIYCVGDLILGLWNLSGTAANEILRILAIGQAVNIGTSISGMILLMAGGVQRHLQINIVNLFVISAGLGCLVIFDVVDIVAIAWIFCLAQVATNVLRLIFARKIILTAGKVDV